MKNSKAENYWRSKIKSTFCKKNGITLVSLAVTIVVSLILAGVTVKVAVGDDSLLAKAKEEKQNTEILQGTYQDEINALEEELKKDIANLSADVESGTNYINVTNVRMIEYSGNVDSFEFYLKDDEGNYNKLTSSSTNGVEIKRLTHNKLYNIKIIAKNGEKEIASVVKPIRTAKLLCADLLMTKANNEEKYESNTLTNSNVKVSLVDKNQNAQNTYSSLTGSAQTISKATATTEINKSGKTTIRVETTDGTNTVTSSDYVVYIDNEAPIVTKATATTNSISTTITDNLSGIVGYAITTSDTAPSNFTGVSPTTSFSTTLKGQVHGTTYYIWAKDAAGNVNNGTTISTEKVADLTPGNVTFTYDPDQGTWTKGDVVATASTTVTGFTLQTSKDNKTWESTEKQTLTDNGPVYARLWDGTNYGGSVEGEVSNIDKEVPTVASAEIKNLTPAGYDVYVYGVTDVGSGVNRVQFPTWTENNGQDDIQSSWSTNSKATGTKQSDGTTWVYHVSAEDHNNEAGAYITHVYVYDNVENSNGYGTELIPKVTVPKVKITYDENHDSITTTDEKVYNTELGTLPTPTREGYTFDGWFTEATGGTQISSTTKVPLTDTTYYAHWTVNNLTITYDFNGGTSKSDTELITSQAIKETYHEKFILPTPPTRTGYTFIGWFVADYKDEPLNYYADTYSDLKEAFGYDQKKLWNHYKNYGQKEGRRISQYLSTDTVKITGDTTLYAGWIINSYTLTVNPNGGTWNSNTASQTFTQDFNTTKTISEPTREGYIFKGWALTTQIDNSNWVELMYQAPGYAGFGNAEGAKSANTVYLYSQLGQIDKFMYNDKYEFIIAADENGKQYRWSQTSNPLTTTSVSGYTNISNGFGGLVYNNTSTLLACSTSASNWWEAIGMYARRTNPISSTDQLWTNMPVHFYAKADSDLSNLSSYIITGTLDSSNNYIFRDEDITLQAVWEASQYSVTCEDWFVDSSNNKKVKIATQTAKSYKYGTVAKGSDWETSDNGSYRYHDCTETTVEARETTVYRYYYVCVDINILNPSGEQDYKSAYFSLSNDNTNWDTNLTNESSKSNNLPYGTVLYIKDLTPYYEYYEYDTCSGCTYADNQWTYTVTEPNTMTIKMKYKSYNQDLNYLVDGTCYWSGYNDRIQVGLKIGGEDKGYCNDFGGDYQYGTAWEIYGVKLDNVTLTGYQSNGTVGTGNSLNCTFYTISISPNNLDYGSVDASSIIVWPNETYSTSSNVLTISDGRKVTATTKEANGYATTFSSWSPTNGTVTSATTVTANFARTANTYTVAYDANGGSGSMSTDSIKYNESYTTKANTFTKTGYTFKGWNEKSDGTGTDWTDWIGKPWTWTYTKNITLYAIWTPNTYTVTYDANGGSGSMAIDSIKYNESYKTKANTFTRTGYTFKGWNEKSDGTGTDWTDYIGKPWTWTYTKNITLYAIWKDETKPVVTGATATTNSISITATDDGSGIVGYAVTKSSTAPTSFTSCTNTKSFSQTVTGKAQSTTYYVWVKDAAGNVSEKKSVTTETVAELNESNTKFEYDPTTWTKGNVNVTITTTVTDCRLQYSLDETNWTNYTKAVTMTKNGPIYARVVDSDNQSAIGYATGNVANIDKVAPNNFTPTATSTKNSITLSGSTTDVPKTDTNGCSGIKAYYFSKDNGSTWEGGTTATSYTFTGLTQGTAYILKMKAVDNAQNAVITETVSIQTLTGFPIFTYTGRYEVVNDDDTAYTEGNENWKIRFLTSGTLTMGADVEIDVFLVGGGGAGSNGGDTGTYNTGAGGGGGYTKTHKNYKLTNGTSYEITIGDGGAINTGVLGNIGQDGGASSAFGITVKGGQGAQGYNREPDWGTTEAGNGGSGGGYIGGNGGSDGANGTGQKAGTGQGTTTREFDEAGGTLYAGGGGGSNGGTAGAGGGGAGAKSGVNNSGADGKANTGGGGGGGSWTDGNNGGLKNCHAGGGGSGIVIIRNARETTDISDEQFYELPSFSYTGTYEVVNDDDTMYIKGRQNWKIRFLTSGILTMGEDLEIDAFVVGGGGAGSNGGDTVTYNTGAGGGGGYTKTEKKIKLTSGTAYEITVGDGGAMNNTVLGNIGEDGGTSSAFGITASGGKGSQGYQSGTTKAGNGGSGGGYIGGNGGSDGANGTGQRAGTGQGTTTREFDEAEGTLYAGGGGGSNGGTAGAGGGGAGAKSGANHTGADGEANTGGGGGGGSWTDGHNGGLTNCHGGAGGSGIVIIRNAR